MIGLEKPSKLRRDLISTSDSLRLLFALSSHVLLRPCKSPNQFSLSKHLTCNSSKDERLADLCPTGKTGKKRKEKHLSCRVRRTAEKVGREHTDDSRQVKAAKNPQEKTLLPLRQQQGGITSRFQDRHNNQSHQMLHKRPLACY